MNANDLIMDLEETYGSLKDSTRQSYRDEFKKYSTSDLLRIKNAIVENHEFNKPPTLGKIFAYMRNSGVARKKDVQRSWFKCSTCDTTYTIKTAVCPTCAWKNESLQSEYGVVYGMEYPDGLKFFNRVCLSCPEFIGKKPIPRGSTCEAMGSFNHTVKSGLNCASCPCARCCNDYPKREAQDVKRVIKKGKEIF